jgi:short-subunit dehydrogenase
LPLTVPALGQSHVFELAWRDGHPGGASVIGSGTARLFLDEGRRGQPDRPQQFGCIDVHVNSAGIALLNDIEATTLDDTRATIRLKVAVIH